MSALKGKIQDRSARIVVMGIGYVGLPLLVEFAKAGFAVTGYDKDPEKVRLLSEGVSYISDVPTECVRKLVKEGRLKATTSPATLRDADAVIVCVPTPLNKTREPDMRHILAAADELLEWQSSELLVVLESTTYPGTTGEILVPQLTSKGARLGTDIFVAFSPERVDPGNKEYRTRNTPKVIGGASEECLEMALALYSTAIETLVPVSSTDTAETVKLLENTFRAVNIGLVNEVAMMSRKLGVDPFEVIRAASTKPFGFMPFYPGPGLGGHCIPVDPLYLSWKLKSLQYEARFIGLADSINSSMPGYVVGRLADCLNEDRKPLNGSKILIYGVAYKADIDDVRESPALGVIHELLKRGSEVSYLDPHIPRIALEGIDLTSVPEDEPFQGYDAVVIVTAHKDLPAQRMVREATLILDTRDALWGIESGTARVEGL